MLTMVDEYTRECLTIDVSRQYRSEQVLDRLAELFVERGSPTYLRSANGSQFTAPAVREWLAQVGVKTVFIEPGSPWENGYNERFNGTLRQEVLNAEWFTTTKQAQSSSMTGSDSTITRALIKRSKCARQSQKPN